jgi:type II secretory pathway pseudopilin PulG
MKSKPTATAFPAARRRCRAFTLAEALAALAFLAIVIPVAVQGLSIASQAGEVAQRKSLAARVAERMINELVVTRQWQSATGGGTVQEGPFAFQWKARTEAWVKDPLKLLTVDVAYTARGQQYTVRVSTLVDTTLQ